MYALAALALLVAVRNYGVWSYILRTPSSLDGKSFKLWLSFGIWPLILAVAAWATMLGLGRRTLGAAKIRIEGGRDGLIAAALGLGLLGQAVFLLGWAGGLKPFSLAILTAAVGPWLLRTWINTGDPLWPLLRLAPAAAELAARNARTNLWNWPPPAWLMTHDGPLFLLAPLAGLVLLSYNAAKRPSRFEGFLWIPAPLLLLLAFRHHEAWRFMIPVYAAAALACSRYASAAFAGGPLRRVVGALLILGGASPIFGLTQNNELFAVLGPRSSVTPEASPRVLFEDRTIDISSFYREAASTLPPDSKVLLFREVRGYGAGFAYMWGDPLNQNLVDYRRLKDFDELYTRLKELGVTHVLDHEASHLYGEDPLTTRVL